MRLIKIVVIGTGMLLTLWVIGDYIWFAFTDCEYPNRTFPFNLVLPIGCD